MHVFEIVIEWAVLAIDAVTSLIKEGLATYDCRKARQ